MAVAVGVLGVAAASMSSWGLEAFTGGTFGRAKANFVVVDELPRGLACHAYPDPEKQEIWNPFPTWHGEKTYHASKELQSDEHRQWYHFDADGKTLGHLAQAIARTLRGKGNPLYDPIRDVGNFVIVTNCERVRVSGKKYHYKLYFRNLSKRPGHMRVERFKDLQARFPERIIMKAVWGSLPKTPSSRRIFKERLKLFMGPYHNYYHENPVEYPMHLIKDCTHTSNLRKRDRLLYRVTTHAQLSADLLEKQERESRESKLEAFKKFLKAQIENEGAAAAERLELDELAARAETARFRKVLEDTGGKEPPKRPVKVYMGTNIPRARHSTNKGKY